ncbi:hypothetical protein EX30DRAFT_356381 [Ascodesmis nigricans]|uniref:BZIP domain-containing protein n=1 Tax=Ascodesmis nigricans TaxID=341454 RepID=A0A4S2MPZ9_9PEZI|nr:hypothetical protein EX30DRAFT_356381 [Ascodesmis nigricans]
MPNSRTPGWRSDSVAGRAPCMSNTRLAPIICLDGEKPKRRGPKPDSKPALTRRQELNRQAQRTHRERKERYVKSLEEEVVRLREAFVLVTKEKTRMQDENRAMRQLLDAHGISYGASPEPSIINSQNSHQHNHNHNNHSHLPGQSRFTLHDQTGIDFVLALEQPCMKHMRFLTNATVNDNHDNAYHGHALMLSCPPECHNLKTPEIDWGLKTYDLPVSDLVKLFNLSQRLQLNGELTPIAVWAYIASLEQFPELEFGDFEMLKQELLPKVTCHGFGAVVGEEHVHAAVDKLLISRFGPAMSS